MAHSIDIHWKSAVLLVTADPSEAGRLQSHLAQINPNAFRVSSVSRLEEAISQLRRRPYDLLLISLDSNHLAGNEILCAQGLAPRLPIVLLLRNPDQEVALRAIEAGIQDVLDPEDLRPEALARALRHSLVRHRALTELRRAQQAAGSHSFFDSMTGLANRASFLRRAQERLTMARRLHESPAIVLAGIDGLLLQQKSLGPILTARILQEVGRRLTWCVRRSDLIARLSGDRFAVLLPHVTCVRSVHAVMERARAALGEPMDHPSRPPLRVTASLGAAWFPHDGDSAEALLSQAELALARARALGGNCSRLSQNLAILFRVDPERAPIEAFQTAGATLAGL